MTRFIAKLVIAPLFLFGAVESFAIDTKNLLDLLDEAVINRREYVIQKEHEINELKQLLSRSPRSARYEVCDELCNLYIGVNTDSARRYSDLCLSYAQDPEWGSAVRLQQAQINQAHCLAINGLYEQSKQMLNMIAGQLYSDNKLNYYRTLTQVYIWEAEFSTLPEAFEQTWSDVMRYRDSVLYYEKEPIHKIHTEAIITSYTDHRASNRLVLPMLDTMSVSNPNLRFIANTAASNYEALDMRDSVSYYYALSALSDVTQGVMEHTSLRRLAMMLFVQGDVTRAYHYINVCMEDAQACGARLRTIQMAEDLPVILNAYQEKVSSQNRALIYTIIFLALLLLAVIISLYNIYKIQQRLKEARSKVLEYLEGLRQSKRQLEHALQEVRTINKDLKESNQIKETYITHYMKDFSAGIAKLEAYQQMLLKVAHTSNYGKLVQTIKDTEILDHELDAFYQSFDETFLGLFPTFVKEFNSLLRPEEQLPEPEEHRLSTELRIFALIRLGINDSEEIASFLRYSIKTIYNYRTKIRNKALGDRAMLEEQLMGIGISEV